MVTIIQCTDRRRFKEDATIAVKDAAIADKDAIIAKLRVQLTKN